MKFVLLTLFAIVLVANAKVVTLQDMVRFFENNNDIESGASVATEALYIPMKLRDCNNSACNSICKALGFNHGTCVSSTTCHCYN